jgi:two-component sensor histidine kinase
VVPGLVTLVSGYVLGAALFSGPLGSIVPATPADEVSALVYFAGGAIILGCTGWLRAARATAERRAGEASQQPDRVAALETSNAKLQRARAESHHRVKNNLQALSAMVDLRLLDARDGAVSAEDLRSVSAHLQCLAGIHDLLTENAKSGLESDVVPAQEILSRLCSLLASVQHGRCVTLQAEEALLPASKAGPLAMLTQEIVANAIKHGRGDVEVRLTVEDHTAMLAVTDHGGGFAPGFDPSASAHTGLDLIRTLATWDLRGEVRYENAEGGGGRVVVTFPVA